MFDLDGMSVSLTLAQGLEPAAPSDGGGATDTGGDGATTQVPAEGGDPAAGGGGQQASPGIGDFLFPILLMVAIMWVLLILPQRREKKKRAQMMTEMKKGAKVQTVGGILGTIVELKEHEVVIKVDESTNARMRFTRGAIHSVLPDGKPTEEK